ncbi:hypothetical protein Tco_0649612 [Tanacetum coccineum]
MVVMISILVYRRRVSSPALAGCDNWDTLSWRTYYHEEQYYSLTTHESHKEILKRYRRILPKEVFEEILGDNTQRDIKEILGDTTQIDIEEILGDTTKIDIEEILGDTTQIDIEEILGDTTQRDIEEILGDTTQRDTSMYLGNNISG